MRNGNKKGFTLVELIVAITILAVLATIWFLAFKDYTRWARDSVRYSDVWVLTKGLELFHLKTGSYPDPDNYSSITHSWVLLWKQGVIWENVIENLNTLSSVPIDPLFTNEYAYSVSYDNQLFQIWLVTEEARE